MTDDRATAGAPADRRALLARLLKERAAPGGASAQAGPPAAAVSAPGPLSFPQQRLWIVDQLAPGSSAYGIGFGLRFTGSLNHPALEQSLNLVLQRHDVLRASFPVVDDAPVQVIAPYARLTLASEQVAVREPASARELLARELVEQETRRPFDLARGPVFRARLFRLDTDDHVLAIAFHHIVSDAWSVRVFVRELATAYDAMARGAEPALEPLTIQYAGFAREQHESVRDPRLESQIAYWKEQLDGAPAQLELPTDAARPQVPTFSGALVSLPLSPELSEALRGFSRGEGATLFMTMLAGFQLLLSRLSGQTDVVVGTPIAGRTRPEVENLIGCFLNTLVMRTRVEGDLTFAGLVRRVRETALSAFANQDVPFERVLEALRPSRDVDRMPLFQVFFNMLGPERSRFTAGSASVQFVMPDEDAAKFDLTLYVVEGEQQITLRAVYNPDLFQAIRIEEMLSQLQTILQQGVARSAQPIADITLETDRAKQVLPDARLPLEPAELPTVPETIFARAGERPDDAALEQAGVVVTYGDLASRARAIAAALTAGGARPGDVVAVTGPASPGFVAAMVGVMASRCVLLTLDRRLPAERKALMLREARAGRVVHVGGLRPEDAWMEEGRASLHVDAAAGALASAPASADVALPRSGDAAYIFFTSGTTGVPKAVLGVHRGLSHFVGWQRTEFGIGPGDRASQLTGLSFDVVLREIFTPLTSGATLCLRPAEFADELAADRVLPWMEQSRITVLHTVPTLAQAWLADVPAGVRLDALRRVFLAGEPLSGLLVRRWRAAFPKTGEIVNLYGPTETTLAKFFYRVPADCGPGIQPVGRPLSRTQALVLREGRRLCGIGESGEITIRTPYRTLGYANSVEDTERRFVANPFANDESDRIYLTGDRGRYRPDGVLEILGRADDQVKIRGVRIELDEVTAALCKHPLVRQGAVVVREDDGEKRLVAYAVTGSSDETVAIDIQQRLQTTLPDYMVPAAVVLIDALPVTANGKLDRSKLPAPSLQRETVDAFVPPRTPVEEDIAAMWRDLLRLERVGVHQNFFDAGGHSLLATQLISRVRSAFRIELPLRAVYEAPTLAGIAARVTAALEGLEGLEGLQGMTSGDGRTAAPIARLAQRSEPPASSGQRQLWLFDRLHPGQATYNIVAAVRFAGVLDREALQRAVSAVVQRHDTLRTTLHGTGAGVVQRVAAPEPFMLPLVDVTTVDDAAREETVRGLYDRMGAEPFDLARGPLFRASVIKVTDADHRVVVVMHHAVGDVWSLGVLFREIAGFYRTAVGAGAPAVPELPIQYGDYAAWQGEYLEGERADALLSFWKRELEGAPRVLDLPSDRPRPSVQSYQGVRRPFSLSPAVSRAVRDLGRREGVTLFTTLGAAYSALLHRYTRQDDLLIGFPVAGRTRGEVESLIGFFVNMLVLRADLSGDPSFRELLKRIQGRALGAYAHQDLPFERLVDGLQPERDPSRNPLFQVAFAVHNTPMPPVDLPGLSLSLEPLSPARSRFDLTLALWEDGDRLAGSVEYNSELFDADRIERLIGHYETLLAAATERPDASISALRVLPADERRLILEGWNDTALPYPAGASLHELFDRQAVATPDATAVAFADGDLTFRELDRRANQLAQHLRTLGVTHESLVGVCVDRSFELVVAILGIVKAGAAYVPLDPAYPVERLATMAEDAALRVVVCQQRLERVLPTSATRTNVRIDADWAAIATQSGEAVPVVSGPDSLAYVIYTSGSTGIPKGAAIPHRGVTRLVLETNYIQLTPEDRIAQASSSSFDAATFEIWGALLTGAQLVGIEKNVALSPREFAAELASRRITTLFITTALFNAVAREVQGAFGGLTHLLFGGEAVDPAAVREVLQHQPPRRLLHVYGPTETTTFASWFRVEDVAGGARTVPIGGPIGNTTLYVVDPSMQPVPAGVPGELFIGGAGLARGYLKRPDITAERFVPNPFATTPGERLYRTGDLVRWTADGDVEFIGRIDGQVKIRGFRIELREIEAVLAQHPAVRDAAVKVHERAGDKRIAAYLIARGDAPPQPAELREFLKRKLPDYMVPSAFTWMERFPVNANGKIDARALPAPVFEAAEAVVPSGELERRVTRIWTEVLGIPAVGLDDNFFDLGGHSLLLITLERRLREALECEVKIVELFQFPTIRSFVEHLQPAAPPVEVESAPAPVRASGGIAIVGMAGRFPGAPDVARFWNNLKAGLESVTFFSDDELAAAGISRDLLQDPAYVRARGIVADADRFDARFFGYTPREAELIDPQQRVFLECAWEALEHAGCDPEQYAGRIGVYAGTGINTYLLALAARPDVLAAYSPVQIAIASDKDFLPTRVSYKLNLTGPSVNVQTACSTSLVAVHVACQSLLSGDCDMALAGGVRITVPQESGYRYQTGSILSPDGHCRAFDAGAQGTVSGNGVAIVVLKRVEDAIANGDTIFAVVKGSAINNDGSLKVGFTAPAVQGQAQVIADAHRAAGIAPGSVTYVEAHGTGTDLGDPVEMAALGAAFSTGTDETGYCAIGSLKTNVGHLDAAAGATGLIKAALAVHEGAIPPSLHFSSPNPKIDFASSPFFVNTTLSQWPAVDGPRRAGVSSFGLGGTNAHVVLEEAPVVAPGGPARHSQLLVVSARSEAALEAACDNLAAHLAATPDLNLADVAFTLQTGRHRFDHRRFVVCTSAGEAAGALGAEPGRGTIACETRTGRAVAFMFPGQGAQQVNMGRALYEREPLFREHLDRCAALLEPHLGFDLRTVLYPEGSIEAAAERLVQTAVAQPALFAVEYSLAQLWMSWGVMPSAMIGHSVGEYVAACLAGVMTLPDALALVATRGRLMQAAAPGSMLSVPLGADDLMPSIGKQLSIAAVNTATSTVVSGPTPAIAALQQRLAADGVETKLLKTSHAFHSSMMDPALPEFRAAVQAAALSAPTRPFVSNLTGGWITAEQATSADYWVEHLRRAVRFHDGLQTMLRDSPPVLLEVGPGRTLASLGREAARSLGTYAIASFENDTCVHAAGQLWLAGVTIEWSAFHGGERRRRVAGLPTYPFERQRYWIETTRAAVAAAEAPSRLPIHDWFSTPAWTTAMAAPDPVEADIQDGAWLVFGDRGLLADTVARAIADRGGSAIAVLSSDRFAEVTPDLFEIRSADRGDYFTLFETLARNGVRVRRIVHAWPEADGEDGSAAFAALLSLVQAVGQHFTEAPLGLTIVTSGAHDVTGAESLRPSAALALGAVRVVPMEYRNLSCVAIDIDGHRTDGATIVRESVAPVDAIVALRGGRKWVQTFRPLTLPAANGAPARLRHRGVYLITGGAGGVGVEIARYLARTLQARLVLTGRAVTPSGTAATEIAALEAAGAEVIYLQADAADAAAMKAAVAAAIARFGTLNGLIHAAGADKTPCAIHEIDSARCADQFRPRVAALSAIEQVVSGLDLDVVVLTSSLSSVLGAAGHLPYTAAHLYMDAFAQRANRDGATPWVVINWDNWTTWKSAPIVRRDEHRAGMTAAEGTEAFARVLGSTSATHVVVSSEDLARRTMRIGAETEREAAAGTPARAAALHPRPALSNEYLAPTTSTEIVLVSIWEDLLGIGGIGVRDNFFELGGDSVTSIQVVARAGARGLRITTRQAFELPTVAELAAAAGGTETRAVSQEVVTGPVPLTPIQRWFFDQNIADPHHFNQAVLLEVDRAIDIDVLAAAVRTVSARHDALRLRYWRERGSWQQTADRAPAIHVSRVDLSHVSPGGLQDAIELTAADAQSGLDLATGRLLTLTWMDLGPRRAARLLIIAHHLVIDAISWGVLLEELYLALDQSASGASVTLPPVTTPFQGWARAVADRAGAPDLVAEVDYWTGQQWHDAAPLPTNGPAHANTVASSFRLASSLTADETSALIQDGVTRHNAQAQELLLAALHQTFAAWTGGGPLHVHLEGHGRDGLVEGADLSRTVGWFTTMYPVLLDVPAHASAVDAVAAVKRQVRGVPNGGIGYGVLKYLSPDAAVRRQMARIPDAAVSFLYMGRGDQASPATGWMRAASEPIGQMRSLRGRRPHAIDVIATVIRGQLQVTWTFSEALHHRATVEALAQGFLDALRGIIAARPGTPTLAAEDFPAARLEQDELDRLLSTIKIGGTN